VVAELPWTPSALAQVEDRLDRIGQTRKVYSHIMLGSNGIATIDERILALLEAKARITGMIHDGAEDAIMDDDQDTSVGGWLLDSYADDEVAG